MKYDITVPSRGNYELPTRSMGEAIRYLDTRAGGKVVTELPNIQVMDYQPGNGTRYVVSFTFLGDLTELGRDAMEAPPNSAFMMIVHNMGSRRPVFISRMTQYYDLDKLGLGVADSLALVRLCRHITDGD